tara:strand:+ start:88 stop:387 length:300 start_codon:yes stop_codon:yes gene_type:complete
MSRKKFLFVKDAADDATYIDVDRVHDLEVTSATAFNINASDNEGGAINAATVACSDSTLAVKELARLMSTANTADIVVADDIAGIYMAHVTGVSGVEHS